MRTYEEYRKAAKKHFESKIETLEKDRDKWKDLAEKLYKENEGLKAELNKITEPQKEMAKKVEHMNQMLGFAERLSVFS